MKFSGLGILLLLCFCSFGQEKSKHFCSEHKSKTSFLKSNTLTVNEIAETEKYDVSYYFLNLNMTNLNTDISGTVEIHITALENLDTAIFELFESLLISEIRVQNVVTNFYRVQNQIKIPINAIQGDQFDIAIDYNGTPPNVASNPLGGGGLTNDSSPSWGNQVTWSLSEPFSAFEWFPCKQSLTDKADSSKVFVTIPSNCKAGSNGVLQNIIDLGNGFTRYEWVNSYPIDYYLISVAIAEYVDYSIYANPEGSTGPVLIQNYIYNNPGTLSYFKDEIDETVDFMELFAELFGPFPFQNEKYGHCMAPLSGGMEHQTMTTQGYFDNWLTAHELGHQWWGDHVTCSSWADIWINEGFASYSEYLMLENLYPADKNQNMLDRHNDIMDFPGGSIWVLDSLNPEAIFNYRLTYQKGAAFVHTLRYIINNDSLFFQVLKEFQSDFSNSTASALDMKEKMEEITGLDLTNAFEEWYYGEGFPTYSVNWNTFNDILYLQVNQTTSQSNVTPYFTNPIDLKITRSIGGDTIIRIPINGIQSIYEAINIPNVTNIISIDPNNWIINVSGTIQQDESLVGISENTYKENEIKIYPNPTNGPIFVEVEDNENQNLQVFDTKGRLILTKDFYKKIEIDLTSFQSGSYLLKIENQNGDKKIHRIVSK